LIRGLGSDNIDFRLRQTDFRDDGLRDGAPWLGMSIEDVATLDRALVIGSFLRKDHPLLAHRLRQAVKRGAQVSSLHSVDDNWLLPIAHRAIVRAKLSAVASRTVRTANLDTKFPPPKIRQGGR